jgi:hypothetical protein
MTYYKTSHHFFVSGTSTAPMFKFKHPYFGVLRGKYLAHTISGGLSCLAKFTLHCRSEFRETARQSVVHGADYRT